MLTFHEYIEDCRKKLTRIASTAGNKSSGGKILADFVVGGPSGDLDSIVSTLLRAYYLASTYYKLIRKEGHRHVFPVLPIKSVDFEINGVARDILRSVNISQNDLIFIDEVVALPLGCVDIGRVNLCNHSKLAPELHFFEPHVYSIIDCHKDSGSYESSVHENLRIIDENVLCTCSLLAEMYVAHEEMFFSQYYSNPLDPLETQKVTSKLLFNTIIYQTSNLDQQLVPHGRNHIDIKMADYFINKFNYQPAITLDQMQSIMQSYKFWSNLSIYDKIRCNFKIHDHVRKFGISSIPLQIAEFAIPIKSPNTGKRYPKVGYTHKEIEGYEGIQNVVDILYDNSAFLNQVYDFMESHKIKLYIILTEVKQEKQSSSDKSGQKNCSNNGDGKAKILKSRSTPGFSGSRSKYKTRANAREKSNTGKQSSHLAEQPDNDVSSRQVLVASTEELEFTNIVKTLCKEHTDLDLMPMTTKNLCFGISDMGEEITSCKWGGNLVENIIEGENEHVHYKELYVKLFEQGNLIKGETDVLQSILKFFEWSESYGHIKYHAV